VIAAAVVVVNVTYVVVYVVVNVIVVVVNIPVVVISKHNLQVLQLRVTKGERSETTHHRPGSSIVNRKCLPWTQPRVARPGQHLYLGI